MKLEKARAITTAVQQNLVTKTKMMKMTMRTNRINRALRKKKTELEKIKEATNKMIAALTRKGQLKEGTFDGEGGGFNTTKGNIKTKTTNRRQ